jgi:hypothetical protein
LPKDISLIRSEGSPAQDWAQPFLPQTSSSGGESGPPTVSVDDTDTVVDSKN